MLELQLCPKAHLKTFQKNSPPVPASAEGPIYQLQSPDRHMKLNAQIYESADKTAIPF